MRTPTPSTSSGGETRRRTSPCSRRNATGVRKKDSKGNTVCWTGYKLHLTVADGDIPVGAVLTEGALPRQVGRRARHGHLHDAHGGRFVRVRGAKKVFLHLLFGLLVIAVEQASAIL